MENGLYYEPRNFISEEHTHDTVSQSVSQSITLPYRYKVKHIVIFSVKTAYGQVILSMLQPMGRRWDRHTPLPPVAPRST